MYDLKGHNKQLTRSVFKSVRTTLHTFATDVELQELDVMSVYVITLLGGFKTLCNEQGPLSPLIIKAMKTFTSKEKIQSHGCGALINLAIYEAGGRDMIGKEGGCEVIITAMKTYPGNEKVQMNGCWALNNLLGVVRCDCKEICVRVKGLGGLQVIVKAMEALFHEGEVYHRGTWAISKLVDYDAETAKLVVDSGGIEAILKGMKAHINDVRVVLEVSDCLSLIAEKFEGDRAQLMEGEMLRAVIKGIMVHIDSDSAISIWDSLCRLVKSYEGDKAELMEMGLLDAELKLIEDYNDADSQMEEAFSIITTTLALHSAGCKAELFERGVFKVVAEKMKEHHCYEKVIAEGCSALTALIEAHGNDIIGDGVEGDIVNSLVYVLNESDEAEVMEAIISFLIFLTEAHSGMKAMLLEASAVDLVNEFLAESSDNENLQTCWRELLEHLQPPKASKRRGSKRQRLSEP